MGTEESHYLDDDVDRVRSLCRAYKVPFSERKSIKCGKRCKILSTKKDYMKVRFQDESEFWFPCQAIKMKNRALGKKGDGNGNSRNNLSFDSQYQGLKTSKHEVKPGANRQIRSSTLNNSLYQYQQQEPYTSSQKFHDESSIISVESSSRGYWDYESTDGISKHAASNEKTVEVPNDRKKLTFVDKYSNLHWMEPNKGIASRSSICSTPESSLYLLSTTHEQCEGSHFSKWALDRNNPSEVESIALGYEPTGIAAPVSYSRKRSEYQISSQYDQQQQPAVHQDYRRSENLWIGNESISSLNPESYIDSGPLRLRDAWFKYPVGLYNLGNTCYMNAALQCLFNNRMIMEAVDLYYQSRLRPRVNSMTREFLSLAKKYALAGSRPGRSISPEFVRDTFVDMYPEFEGECEHDTSEFLSYLLAEIGETPTLHENTGTIDSLFRLHCRIERRYNKRSAVLTSTDSQLLMSLPVVISHKKSRRNVKVELTDLEAAIAYESQYMRQHCEITINGQRHSSFEQRSTIIASSTPPFLIVHLKRFEVSKGYLDSMRIEKMNVNVNVPLRLDLSEFTDDPAIENKYMLVGAICHLGKRSSSGHFYSIIRPYEENYWFKADDYCVSEQSSIRPEVKHFYVCFYQKISSYE